MGCPEEAPRGFLWKGAWEDGGFSREGDYLPWRRFRWGKKMNGPRLGAGYGGTNIP